MSKYRLKTWYKRLKYFNRSKASKKKTYQYRITTRKKTSFN